MVAITLSPSPAAPRTTPAAPSGLRLVPSHGPARRPAERVPYRLVGVAPLVLVVAVALGYLVSAPTLESSGPIPVQDTVHVVAEGETMWSIANAVAPAGEAATYVERLVEVNGTAQPAPGETLRLPVP